MDAKAHYDHHLGNFYPWTVGDFYSAQAEQQQFFESRHIRPFSSKIAIDLGAGHGLQSVSLARLGFTVKAIDFNRQLLEELKERGAGHDIEVISADLLSFRDFAANAELIVCMGDTLSHLSQFSAVADLLGNCYEALVPHGKLVLSYRDYSRELRGNDRFLPVRSDEDRILTCILEYSEDKVTVTDQLYERSPAGWVQKVSSYQKLRISPPIVNGYLTGAGFSIEEEMENRMVHTIATKKV